MKSAKQHVHSLLLLKHVVAALLMIVFLSSDFIIRAENTKPQLPPVLLPSFHKNTINIIRYGAKPDGVMLGTTSINANEIHPPWENRYRQGKVKNKY